MVRKHYFHETTRGKTDRIVCLSNIYILFLSINFSIRNKWLVIGFIILLRQKFNPLLNPEKMTLKQCVSASEGMKTKELDVLSYQKVNATFRRRMICRIGIVCGFFVEINFLLNAMLYCLAHHIKFQLYSEYANFSTGEGWTEFFQPFCDEVHESFHQQYNFHRLPSLYHILRSCIRQKSFGLLIWKLKSGLKTWKGRLIAFVKYKEYVLFAQDVPEYPEKHYNNPELGIKGSYIEAYGILARMIWKFQPEMLRRKIQYKEKLALPPLYEGIHIRGGDKITEARLISGKSLMGCLNPKEKSSVFVLTDDYRLYQELQDHHPDVHFSTLCQPEERGYLHKAFCKKSPQSRYDAVVRLLISVDYLLGAHSFIGSITTGPSVFIMKLRLDDALVQAVDCPKEDLASVLSLSIDKRAAISNRNVFVYPNLDKRKR